MAQQGFISPILGHLTDHNRQIFHFCPFVEFFSIDDLLIHYFLLHQIKLEFLGSLEAGEENAALYTLIENCKAEGVKTPEATSNT